MSRAIPTNIISGFLGVGKTTLIRRLLETKPEAERWAVLVNEFGEVGIDGALMQADDIAVKEVPGGCMCCSVGLPSRAALNQLIEEQNPDRILIEPTGLAHPVQVIEMFSTPEYAGVLEVRATVGLVDPWCLTSEQFRKIPAFDDQLFDSASDKDKAILIHAPQIAGAKPAIGCDGFGGFVWPVKIALHDIAATHQNFAFDIRPQNCKIRASNGDFITIANARRPDFAFFWW